MIDIETVQAHANEDTTRLVELLDEHEVGEVVIEDVLSLLGSQTIYLTSPSTLRMRAAKERARRQLKAGADLKDVYSQHKEVLSLRTLRRLDS